MSTAFGQVEIMLRTSTCFQKQSLQCLFPQHYFDLCKLRPNARYTVVFANFCLLDHLHGAHRGILRVRWEHPNAAAWCSRTKCHHSLTTSFLASVDFAEAKEHYDRRLRLMRRSVSSRESFSYEPSARVLSNCGSRMSFLLLRTRRASSLPSCSSPISDTPPVKVTRRRRGIIEV